MPRAPWDSWDVGFFLRARYPCALLSARPPMMTPGCVEGVDAPPCFDVKILVRTSFTLLSGREPRTLRSEKSPSSLVRFGLRLYGCGFNPKHRSQMHIRCCRWRSKVYQKIRMCCTLLSASKPATTPLDVYGDSEFGVWCLGFGV